jgi:hypothetical protein
MPVHLALTGPALSLAGQLTGAAGRRTTTHWARGKEGHKLIKEMARRVKQDGLIPYEIRDSLAAELPSKVRVEPDVRGALTLLLEGRHVPEAESALAQLIAELCKNVVAWPEGFDAAAFGAIAAAHAAAGVNAVKATDREAAHVDAVAIRELMQRVEEGVAARTTLLDVDVAERPGLHEEVYAARIMLRQAQSLIDAMWTHAEGYRKICGSLLAFGESWSPGQRESAIAAFERWIWDRSISNEIDENRLALRWVYAPDTSLSDLLRAADDYWEVVVAVMLSDKRNPDEMARVQRALRDAGAPCGPKPVLDWAWTAFNRILGGEASLEAAKAANRRLQAEVAPDASLTRERSGREREGTWILGD